MEELHQKPNFGFWPLPIFVRECEQRQVGNTELAGRFNHGTHRVLAPTMALASIKAAVQRPASVAVHHNGNMAGEPRRIDTQTGKFTKGP